MPNFTKKAIQETFLRLLDEKPLNQITVKQIVETCGINRNSFYYHYRDIPDLIEEIATQAADRIIREHPTVDSIEEALTATIDFAAENRRAILHIYRSVNRDLFEQYLWKVCDYVITAYGNTAFADARISRSDREVLERFFRCECFGVAIEWMNSRMTDEIYAYIKRLCELYKGLVEDAVRGGPLPENLDKTEPRV